MNPLMDKPDELVAESQLGAFMPCGPARLRAARFGAAGPARHSEFISGLSSRSPKGEG